MTNDLIVVLSSVEIFDRECDLIKTYARLQAGGIIRAFLALMLTFGTGAATPTVLMRLPTKEEAAVRLIVLVSIVWLPDESRAESRCGRMIVEVVMSRPQSSAIDFLVNGKALPWLFAFESARLEYPG